MKAMMFPMSHTTRPVVALRALAAAALLAPVLTEAATAALPSVTAAITGVGDMCRNNGPFAPPSNCQGGFTLTGTVKLTQVGGPSEYSDGSTVGVPVEAMGSNWMTADLQLQWTNGTGASGSLNVSLFPGSSPNPPTVIVSDDSPFVVTGTTSDRLLFNAYADSSVMVSQTQGSFAQTYASLSRRTADTSWLNGFGFDLQKGLAPASADTINRLEISMLAGQFNADAGGVSFTFDPDSYIGTFELTSWNVSAVPEPGSWALMGAGGLALLALQRRRRADQG